MGRVRVRDMLAGYYGTDGAKQDTSTDDSIDGELRS